MINILIMTQFQIGYQWMIANKDNLCFASKPKSEKKVSTLVFKFKKLILKYEKNFTSFFEKKLKNASCIQSHWL